MLVQLKIVFLIALLQLPLGSVIAEDLAASYVGRSACADCHKEQSERWAGSHHDLAMQHINDSTVLGDFSNAVFNYGDITSEFYKKNKKYMVRTDDADGKLHDYEIKYTFGVAPLQQYLI